MKPDLPEDERDSSATNKPEAEGHRGRLGASVFQVSSLEPDGASTAATITKKMGYRRGYKHSGYLRDVCIFDGTPLTEFMCLRYLD